MTPQEITAADFPELATFFDRQLAKTQPSPGQEALLEYLRWIERNPARDGLPMGWIIRVDGKIEGQIFCIPQPFQWKEQQHIFALVSHLFVEPAAQNGGAMLLLRFRQLHKKYPLLGATVNSRSLPFWKTIGSRPIPGGDFEYLRIIDWRPVMTEFFARRLSGQFPQAAALAARVANRFSAPKKPDGNLRKVEAAEAAAVFQPTHRTIEVGRSTEFLNWRTKCPLYEEAGLFRFTSDDVDACVMVAMRRRGVNSPIRTLCLLDFWGRIATRRIPLLCAALAHQFRDRVDVIAARDLNSQSRGAFRKAGFRKRAFPCPAVWVLDRDGIPGAHRWRLMPSATDVM